MSINSITKKIFILNCSYPAASPALIGTRERSITEIKLYYYTSPVKMMNSWITIHFFQMCCDFLLQATLHPLWWEASVTSLGFLPGCMLSFPVVQVLISRDKYTHTGNIRKNANTSNPSNSKQPLKVPQEELHQDTFQEHNPTAVLPSGGNRKKKICFKCSCATITH